MIDTDWQQLKKNLARERLAWDKYAKLMGNLKKELDENIDNKRFFIEYQKQELDKEFKEYREKLTEEFKKKQKEGYKQYLKESDKNWKPDIII